ncbi:MAG: hypothetical protein Ct9H300mP11_07090 [Chloroflexota bacterium]|nr:MAG: hypothetical protein Ct9H300mP11_07090 [Chloroflexota bacterium]
MTSSVNGMTIIWACKSANRKVKKGNSVSGTIPQNAKYFAGTQNAKTFGSICSEFGSILLPAEIKSRNRRVINYEIPSVLDYLEHTVEVSQISDTKKFPAVMPAVTGLQNPKVAT